VQTSRKIFEALNVSLFGIEPSTTARPSPLSRSHLEFRPARLYPGSHQNNYFY